MELLLNILNKCGYIVDNEKNQIIDYNNNDIGTLTYDNNLITYSFSDYRKIIFDQINNQVTIHMSDKLDILFKSINNSKNSTLYINLNMNLSNGTLCRLEHSLSQSECCCDYEVSFRHKNFPIAPSIQFTKSRNKPKGIIYLYENGFIDYTGELNPNSHNVEDIQQITADTFLNRLIVDSGLINSYESIEINNIMSTGINIINSSTDELISYFLSCYLNKEKKIPCGKIKLLNK